MRNFLDNLLAMRRLCICVLFASMFLSLPVAASEQDPYEGFNRKVFAFNDFADKWVLKPVAKSYRFITPKFVDKGVSNVFDNLGEVRNLFNAGLQGDLRHAGVATGRLLINSTLGLVGLFDVAKHFGLEERREDFGQTLGVWGVKSGPYLVLPLLGSSNLRDSLSVLPDIYLAPQTYLDEPAIRNSLRGLDLVDTRADLLSAESLISGDRYTFIREIYLQKRASDILNGALVDDFDIDSDDDF